AMLAADLLKQPDKLIGLILFGNNVVNFLAASLGVAIGVRLMGDSGYAVSPFLLTFIFLIFAEVAPKTVAALYPEKIAFPAVYILKPLSYVLYPFVWTINKIANALLSLIGIKPDDVDDTPLSIDELRTVVHEAANLIPARHRKMLISILDLEKVTVDDIMVPRNEITGIDITDETSKIVNALAQSTHTRLPLYDDSLDEIIGLLHTRRITRILRDKENPTPADLKTTCDEPYFVPLGTPLHIQLLNFQKVKSRMGLVVDEYGVIQGLITLEDILEEIVGEYTTNMQTYNQDIRQLDDGSFIINGPAMIRNINRDLEWNLPEDGPKTLNGLILEHLQSIPEAGTSIRIDDLAMEITQVTDNAVRAVKVTKLDH
ncbi:MAG: HlyC/CorC family transporter, partial [Gammaproteobacteria bacterium]